MANPVVDSVTFDQTGYPPGAAITATVAAHGLNVTAQTDEFSGTVTDKTTGESGQGSGELTVDFANPLALGPWSDASGRTWTVQSAVQDGQFFTAVLTSTA